MTGDPEEADAFTRAQHAGSMGPAVMLARSFDMANARHLLDVGDIEGMAEAGARILGDRTEWRRMSAAAREIAVSRYAAEKVVPLYEDVYREVLEGVGKPVAAGEAG